MSAVSFVHLHIHSEYSLLDGSIKIKKLVQELSRQKAPAAALTDHDALYGILEFYLACQAEKINGIIGYEINCEALYLDDKKKTAHLILLAQNKEGYENLLKLSTLANTIGLHRTSNNSTSVNFTELRKYAQGLICLSSCMLGELSQHILANNYHLAEKFLNELRDIFGRNNVFIELIDNGIEEQQKLIQQLVEFASEQSCEIVATADVHYLHKEDKETHLSLLAIKHKLQRSTLKNMHYEAHFHLASAEEMQEKFAKYPNAITNTLVIAQRCKLKIDTKNIFMPEYTEHTGESSPECLMRLARTGLELRKPSMQKWLQDKFTAQLWQEYQERLEYELSVITAMKFSGYFLIVQDFINWAKKKQIAVGPGRGSAAGSLVSYALQITDIDPMRFNLLFERFLNPERISMPDIDTDFCQDRREEVLQYVYHKYGKKSVSQIVTFGRMMAKNAIKNLARINGWRFKESNEFAQLIPAIPGITLAKALSIEPKLQQRLEADERAKTLWDAALTIEGTLSSIGVHAAGVIISDRSLDEVCPLLDSDGQLLTQFENKYTEKIGLIKFDFLGLKTLTVISNTVKLIKKIKDIDIDIDDINLDDMNVYKLISTAHVTGIFQLESIGMRQLVANLQPSCFTDIMALLALFRPGPLGSGMVENFVKRKHGQHAVEYFFPELENILSETYGIIVYQEQVQKIAAVLANYSLGEADLLRRAMGKKDKNEMERQKNRFLIGAQANGYNCEKTLELFELMAKFAEYGFNKSHTTAYSFVTFQTAWLKTYYPTEFMAAIMSCDIDNTDKIAAYIRDCRRMQIKILPPCINNSSFEFSIPASNTIQFGLGAIKGLGKSIINLIVDERNKKGKFISVPEFIMRLDPRKLNKKALENLIKSGVFDSLSINRAELFANIEIWCKTLAKELEYQAQNSLNIFSFSPSGSITSIDNILKNIPYKQTKSWSLHERLSFEIDTLGMYITAHPADYFYADIKYLGKDKLANLAMYLENENIPTYKRQSIKLIGIVTMILEKKNKAGEIFLVLKIEDNSAELELVMFAKQYANLQKPLKISDALFIECKLSKGIEYGMVKGIIQNLVQLSQRRIEVLKTIYFTIAEEFLNISDNLIKLIALLQKYPGDVKVYLNILCQNKAVKLQAELNKYNIIPSDDLIFAIEDQWPGLIVIDYGF